MMFVGIPIVQHFVVFSVLLTTSSSNDPGRTNLALNKPANQSSTGAFSYKGNTYIGPAEYAVDGNVEVDLPGSTCIRAGFDRNPWWTVDLLDIYRVDEVAIVTRNWGFVLTNFTIELSAFTDGSPNGFLNPVMCYYERDWQAQGTTRLYPCYSQITARFVKITRWDWNRDMVMAFCQVLVYGSDTERDFSIKQTTAVTSPGYVLAVVRVRSLLACAMYCRLSPYCTSFTMDDDMSCELLVEGTGPSILNRTDSNKLMYKFLL